MISESDRYITLGSFKRNGEQVNTPLWFAHTGASQSELCAVTSGGSWKVKRIRNFPDVKIARCTASGKVLGDWQDAKAELIEDDESLRQISQALGRKYGWQLALANFFEKLTGKYHDRLAIKLTLSTN